MYIMRDSTYSRVGGHRWYSDTGSGSRSLEIPYYLRTALILTLN